MKPFLKLPKIIINNEDKGFDSVGRIQPDEIADYYTGAYNGTVVVLRSGSSFLCPLTAEQLDEILQAYQEAVINNPGKFGILEIKPKSKLHATSWISPANGCAG